MSYKTFNNGAFMAVNEQVQEMMNNIEDGTPIEKLAGLIVKFDGIARKERARALLIESGVQKLFEELDFYVNKVFYRERQLKQVATASNKVLSLAFKIARLIPKSDRKSREKSVSQLKALKTWHNRILNEQPIERNNDADNKTGITDFKAAIK